MRANAYHRFRNISPGESREQKRRLLLRSGTVENTQRSYRSRIDHFLCWGGLLPASPKMVIDYLVDYAGVLSTSTLAVTLSALAEWHTKCGMPDPANNTSVRKVMSAIRVKFNTPARRTTPLEFEHIREIANRLQNESGLRPLRDNALIQIGFFVGALERTELLGLGVEDLSWVRDGVLMRFLDKTSGDTSEYRVRTIPFMVGPYCPPTALRRWLTASGIRSGPVFRRVYKGDVRLGEQALCEGSLNAILATRAREAGIIGNFSSLSFRKGQITSAYRLVDPCRLLADHSNVRQQKVFDALMTAVQESKGLGYLSPHKVASVLDVSLQAMARLMRVSPEVLSGSPRSETVQRFLRDILRVIRAVLTIREDTAQAVYWYKNQPLLPLDCKTGEQLIAEGRADDVIMHILSLRTLAAMQAEKVANDV